ncbi:MAG: heavy-metal-associated domain-containing protein [Methanomassiliicoccus sp.]|nr:heavy-metal-associated domain-containing protein [Methanomassiliicoccus sp.]
MVGEKVSGDGLETANFKITGLCSCEFKIIEKKMKALEGVDSYSLNPVTNQLKVTYNKSLQTIEGIQKAVSKAGGKASLMKSGQIL